MKKLYITIIIVSLLIVVAIGTLLKKSPAFQKGFESGKKSVLNQTSSNQPIDTSKTEKLEYELLKQFQYDDCSIWQDVYLKSGSVEDLAKELYKQRISQNFRVYSAKDEEKIKAIGDWGVRSNSEKCLLKNECGEDLSNEISTWQDKNMIGFVWWSYDSTDSDNKNSSGRWRLNKYSNGQRTDSIELEDSSSVQPLSYKEVGKHSNAGKEWRDIIICDLYNGESLKYLAQRLHSVYPNDYFKFYDDDKLVQDYIEFDKNYPDIPLTKELEEWSDMHHIAIINKMPLGVNDTPKWALHLFQQVEGLPIDGIYLE